MTTDKQLQGCKIDFANYEDWRFLYSYESNGQDVVLVVTVVDGEDDIEFHLNGQSIGLVPDDFIGCEDIDDCSLLIAKHLIKDNDGEVLTTFVDQSKETLTGVFFEKVLTKDLEYKNGDMDDESWQVLLSANRGYSVNCYDYLEVSEEDVNQILKMISDQDTSGVFEYMNECCYDSNEVLDIWGDEIVSFEVSDENREEVASGNISVDSNNLFEYKDYGYYTIVDNDNHPDYLLIHKDEMKRSWATFRVPKDFNIGEIHFVDRYIIPKNYMLDWDRFGDYMTTIGVFKYRGKLYFADDYGDAGSWCDHHFGVFKWNKEKDRYELLAEMR